MLLRALHLAVGRIGDWSGIDPVEYVAMSPSVERQANRDQPKQAQIKAQLAIAPETAHPAPEAVRTLGRLTPN